MSNIEQYFAALGSTSARSRSAAVLTFGALDASGVWVIPPIVDAMDREDAADPHLPEMERSIICFGIISLARIAGRAICQGASPDSPDIRLAIATLERLKHAANAHVAHNAAYWLSEMHRLAAGGPLNSQD